MAEENRDWGYRRIQGALSNLGHEIVRSTIAAILERHGIEPAPERRQITTWKEFLTRHWDLIVAADFFTLEVWTRRGLQRFIVLFFINLSSRKVEIAGIASVANGLWMSQIGRNLTDGVDGALAGKRYLIHDRDPLFTMEFLLAMELVEGRTLKDVIGGRPLPAEQALGLAVQIGEGLKAAHEKGITHRDIKSANIIVTGKGKAKILEFGLARQARPAQPWTTMQACSGFSRCFSWQAFSSPATRGWRCRAPLPIAP